MPINKGESMKNKELDNVRVVDLLYQAIESEKGGVQSYDRP